MMEQARNKRSNHWIEYDGKRMIKAEWARYFGLKPNSFESIYNRANKDMTIVIEKIKSYKPIPRNRTKNKTT